MGLYPQPNDWTCGPFALKHALVALGRLADEGQISGVAATHWWSGTDEVRLARAAHAFDCDLPMIRRRDPEMARGVLTRYVRSNIPVLLCIDEWEHWVTVVRAEGSRFVVIDSKHDPVLNVVGWPQLRRRWRYIAHEYDEYDPPALFDLHPVKPRFRVSAQALFSVERARFLRRQDNADLAQHWDDYLEDLLEVCKPRNGRYQDALSMAEFLRRHQELLLSRVTYWHGGVEREQLSRLLRNFRFVAETYGLVIPVGATRQALADMSILCAFWAASSEGIGDMYGSIESKQQCRRPRRRRQRTSW